MNRAKAKFLQEKLAQEARAALEMGGSNAPTEGYARAITLIGKVWGLNDSDANEQFDLIQQDREYVQRVEVGDSEPSSAQTKTWHSTGQAWNVSRYWRASSKPRFT